MERDTPRRVTAMSNVASLRSGVVHDLGTDLDIPVGPEVGEDKLRPTIRLGSIFQTKARTVDSRRFGYRQDGEVGQDPKLNALTPNQIFTPDVIGDGGYQFGESTRETDNYSAIQNQFAVYGMADVPVTPWLRVMGGTRVEHNDQEVRTFALFGDSGEPIVSRINKTDVLPGAMLTWSPGTKTNVRVGWGRTVSRPDFREMSPATFSDVTGGRSVKGNEQLTRARIDNFDARLEHYPNPGETLSVAAFAKEFTDPIETVLIVSAERT